MALWIWGHTSMLPVPRIGVLCQCSCSKLINQPSHDWKSSVSIEPLTNETHKIFHCSFWTSFAYFMAISTLVTLACHQCPELVYSVSLVAVNSSTNHHRIADQVFLNISGYLLGKHSVQHITVVQDIMFARSKQRNGWIHPQMAQHMWN